MYNPGRKKINKIITVPITIVPRPTVRKFVLIISRFNRIDSESEEETVSGSDKSFKYSRVVLSIFNMYRYCSTTTYNTREEETVAKSSSGSLMIKSGCNSSSASYALKPQATEIIAM